MRLENNLGGDNLYGEFRVYVEGVQIPFSSANISNTYGGLPTAMITLAPWRGFTEISKGYFPKVQILFRDFNQGLTPYDTKRMIGANASTGSSAVVEATETRNRVERETFKVIFDGVCTSVQDSKSLAGDGGSSYLVMNCIHSYYILDEILFRFMGTNPLDTNFQDSAFGIMVDGGNVGSLYTIEQALAGVRPPADGQITLEAGGSDTSILSDTMSQNYWRLQGMPGVIVALWNAFKRSSYSVHDQQADKSIMTKMYIPLMEYGLQYFTKMSGHPVIEGAIQADGVLPPSAPIVTTQTTQTGEPPVRRRGINVMSPRGKRELIEASEGRHYELYDDRTGKPIGKSAYAEGTPTIGVGHAVSKTDPTFDDKKLSDGEVDKLLDQDIYKAEMAVDQMQLVLTQGQFDALVDLTYNVGPGARGVKDGALWKANGEPSTIIQLFREDKIQEAANAFMSWVYVDGKVSAGLVTRRTRDRLFFLDEPVPDSQAKAADTYSSRGSNEELTNSNGNLIPPNLNGLLPGAIAKQLNWITGNTANNTGTGEMMSFGHFIKILLDLIEYDHVIMNSPAVLGVIGRKEVVDHVYKPRMFAYYSPICNVLLPNMYEAASFNIGTDRVPSRIIYNGNSFTADSEFNATTGVNAHTYIAPHSVRKALANGGNLRDTLQTLRAVPGKYEWGSGVRTSDGQLPYWYSILSAQTQSSNVGSRVDYSTEERLRMAWDKLYPEDPTLNPWNMNLSGVEAYNRLFFTSVDVEFSNIYSQARSGSVEGVFNPYIIPGYPMDIIDPSPLRESYHGFCTSVNHMIDASGHSSTSIGISSAFTFSEIATCYIPGTHPWLLAQLNMDDNMSMYGNTAAFQRACQYYVDVLGVGAADPTILEAYSTGKPIPVKRNLGVWEIGNTPTASEPRMASNYTTTLGNLNLVARNIMTLGDIQDEHAAMPETFIDIDMWNQGSPSVQEIRKGIWVNDQSTGAASTTLRGRDMECSAFLDYDVQAETPDPTYVPGPRDTSVQPEVGPGQKTPPVSSSGQTADVLPKLGKRCTVGVLDESSQRLLANVHPDLVRVVMKVLETRPIVVTSGYRTAAQQRDLDNGGGKYAQGAGNGSRHRKSPATAIDMVPCNNLNASSRGVMRSFAQYVQECASSMGISLRWGGDFSTYDPVHFDLG